MTSAVRKVPPRMTMPEFLGLIRHPAFLLLVGGMFLVNLPQNLVSSQLKLVLFDSGATSRFATLAVSLYAVSVVIGRFICGYALDRVAAHLVAGCVLGLPTVGFVVLISPLEATWALAVAVSLVGLAQGAEGDVGAYLTSRKFSIRHYSFIYSFLVSSMMAAAALGSLILSLTLHLTNSFNPFLILCMIATLLGALCFYFTGRHSKEEERDDLGETTPDSVSRHQAAVSPVPDASR